MSEIKMFIGAGLFLLVVFYFSQIVHSLSVLADTLTKIWG